MRAPRAKAPLRGWRWNSIQCPYVKGPPRPQMIFCIGSDEMTGTEVCEGCCEVIYDRFVMRVGNSPWHEDCLFCSECHTPLTNSCYYKEGRLLCRGDYERRFGVKCGRCAQCLLPHDLVMRTRFSIYHIGCFVCTVCARTLNRGKFTIVIFFQQFKILMLELISGDQYVVRAGQVKICISSFW